MASSISRMQFLRGDFRGQNAPIRPPWAISEEAFIEECTACGDCIKVCPTRILTIGRGRFPQVDFSRGHCTLCGDCVAVCKPKALVATTNADGYPWRIKAHIQSQCLALKGVVCSSCREACETKAISFKLAPGGVAKPEVQTAACNGCGECLVPCPVDAISMKAEAA